MNIDAPPRETALRFGDFRLDRRAGLSRRRDDGAWEPVVLGSRALDVLAALAEARGELVTKAALMEAAWPGTAVEDSNLTVQMAALRRVLDEGRARGGDGGSAIQTVVGRGYRLLPAVTAEADEPPRAAVAPIPAVRPFHKSRLSIVVLPFRNLGGPEGALFAEAITDNLTTDLSRIEGAVVIAHESARHHRAKPVDLRTIGDDLGVRYAVEGSLRALGGLLRVNVQLISTSSGAHVWADRFDQGLTDPAAAEDAIVRRLALGLGTAMTRDEGARSLRERPEDGDALDLVLRAKSLVLQPANLDRFDKAQGLYEEALRLDPRSIPALTGLAQVINAQYFDRGGYWMNGDEPERLATLIADAQALAPTDETVLTRTAVWLETQGRYGEAMAISGRIIETYPNNALGPAFLARSKIFRGEAEEAIPLLEKAIQLDSNEFSIYDRYWRLGFAHLLIRRERESLPWFHRALAAYPDAPAFIRGGRFRHFAAAHALLGEMDEARRALAEHVRLWPCSTVRCQGHENHQSPAYAAQFRHFQHGLRLAGLRDHADEHADFGIMDNGALHAALQGFTPMEAPGARTIGTAELATFLERHEHVVIDALRHFWGRSLPGAIGLKDAGIGGGFADGAQRRLARVMPDLTHDDRTKPIVAVGFNSESFDGRNLALRLVALGYTNVYWYRGGREAWEVAGLPETDLTPQDW